VTKWRLVRRPALFLLFLCVLSFFVALGRPAITDADEAYYAESAREMVELGDWLTPHYNYEFRWQKPVLYYWLTAATYVVLGLGEWSARFWSALAGVGLAFATWSIGRSHTKLEEVGWLAGAIVATSFGYFAIARMALPDLPLALFITLTIAFAFENRWALAGMTAGLGFLMKGPLTLVLPALVLLPVWWRERHTRRVRVGDLATAALVFAIVGLPWYVAMTAEHGVAYLDSFFVGDNFERFATDRFNEPRSPLFYVPVLLGGLLPWTAYGVVNTVAFARGLAPKARLDDETWRLIVWALMPLLFFSASIGKQPRYILPILPPLAVLLAHGMARRLDAAGTGDRAARRDLRIATYATAVVAFVMALILVRARELFLTAIPQLTWAAAGTLIATGAFLFVIARSSRWHRLPAVLPVIAALILLAIQFGALAGHRPEAVEQMAALVRTHRIGEEAVGVHHVFVRNLIFYTHAKQQDLFSDERATAFMRSPERVLMVVRDADLERLQGVAGVRMTTLGEVRYFNTANIKFRSLLLPDLERDVQRVLLVTNRVP
jgi:4-amino-4-deoxy-L-arabinose transferase-like glycosyltransferase